MDSRCSILCSSFRPAMAAFSRAMNALLILARFRRRTCAGAKHGGQLFCDGLDGMERYAPFATALRPAAADHPDFHPTTRRRLQLSYASAEIALHDLQRTLDQQGLEIVDNQKENMVGRKALAEKTRGTSIKSNTPLTGLESRPVDQSSAYRIQKSPRRGKGPGLQNPPERSVDSATPDR